MRWMGGRESDQVEDARGIGPVHIAGGGIGVVVLAIVIGLGVTSVALGDRKSVV